MWAWERCGSRHQQQCIEAPRKPGADGECSRREAAGQLRDQGSCLRSYSLPGPNLCHAPSHTSAASPANPHFRYQIVILLWVLVTCHQKNLGTTLLTNLDCLAGQQDNFSTNSKNDDTLMTIRGFGTFWFKSHCKNPWKFSGSIFRLGFIRNNVLEQLTRKSCQRSQLLF